MKPFSFGRTLALVVLALGSLHWVGSAHAQTFPVVKGTLELGGGISTIALSEDEGGLVAAHPEARIGYFVAEGVQLQAILDTRVWPLGTVGASSHGIAAQLHWYPNLGPRSRNLYLLAGGGGVLLDPPSPSVDSSFEPLLRGGVGMKASLEEAGLDWLQPLHFTIEFRTEYLLRDEAELVSGIGLGLSWFRS